MMKTVKENEQNNESKTKINNEKEFIDPKIVKQIKSTFEKLKIDKLLQQEGVTEIAINEPNVIYYEQNSKWHRIETDVDSDYTIEYLGVLLINHAGQDQAFDRKSPMLSLTLPDGERIQLVRKPAAEHASLTVRIPSKGHYTMDEYEKQGIFSKIVTQVDAISPHDRELKKLLDEGEYRKFLEKAVEYRKNILVSGATGSGKTTFMKTLISLIDHNERIITIEDARELFITQPNKVHLIYPKGVSTSSVTAKSSLEATLRMKPDRIILAEVRGDEAFYFIRACGNGHTGSITSCHADSALMAYEQLALMINASPEGTSLSYDVIKRLIFMTIDISIHFSNFAGERYISGIDFNPERRLEMLAGK